MRWELIPCIFNAIVSKESQIVSKEAAKHNCKQRSSTVSKELKQLLGRGVRVEEPSEKFGNI